MGVRFGEKVRQPAETTLLHETAKFIAYAERLAATFAARIQDNS